MASKRKKRSSKKPIILVVSLIVLAALIGGYFWHKHVHKSPVVTTTTRNIYSKPVPNPNVPGGTTSTNQGSGISSNKGGSSPAPQVSNSVTPSAPVGEFISDHTPNLSGKPHPNTESSTCTTTAGVQCKITFTSGSTVFSLPAQTTDGNGNTSWNWTLQNVGLTVGTWQVAAIAINGNKAASTNDAIKLVVSQ